MTEPRWLNEEEQRTWRAFLWASQLLHDSLDRQLQRDAGIPHAYYVILAMLSEASDRSLTMSQVAEIARLSPSRLSHAAARLEDKGWVARRRNPEDGRQIIATLTDAGLAVVTGAAPGHVAQVRGALFDALTPDQIRQLGEIFGTLLEHLDPDGELTPEP
ncbi:MarR family transcriptional regulator [Actinomadura craniellae]|uniref:MarR family transcriptional regulator n=1 Tax=Actinomadura craniellae TaxID=2231787 RepID=A0A365GX03_9ACTN|nr:MarR family transcriptional regulator [Actinomadura craniellae]RAY11350.1 MarR family transcriptional regulator [Actinomadura craniellae]